METISKSTDFKDVKVVLGLTVNIAGIIYTVGPCYLYRQDSGRDDKVFEVLLIFNKREFCEQCYKYPAPQCMRFPHYHKNDMEAALRVIVALMEIYENPSNLDKVRRRIKDFFS